MIGIIVALWFIAGVFGARIALDIVRDDQGRIDPDVALIALLGPLALFLSIAVCVELVMKKKINR